MNQPEEKKGDAPEQAEPDFVVSAERVESTYNVLNLFFFRWHKAGKKPSKPKVVQQVPLVPPQDPSSYFTMITTIQGTIAHTVRAFREHEHPDIVIAIDGGQTKMLVEEIVKEVGMKCQTAIRNAQGQIILDIDQNGWMWREDKMPPEVKKAIEANQKKAQEEAESGSVVANPVKKSKGGIILPDGVDEEDDESGDTGEADQRLKLLD